MFIQIKYSFLYPHSHQPTATNPHRYHTGIHTTHRQKTRKTNRNPHNPLAPGINTTQPHNPATRNRNKPSNTIHTTHPKLTPRLEQQDRRLRWWWQERETRSTPPKASGGDGDDERHSTPFNPKPTDQAHSTRKQREKKEERAIEGGDGDRRWRWWSTEASGRKIDERKKDWLDERKKERAVLREREREREGAES